MAYLAWTNVTLAVLGVWRGTMGFRAPTTDSTGAPVYLGPEYLLTAEQPDLYVVVAYPGGDEDLVSLGGMTQSVGPMAGATRPRDEAGSIECRVIAETGDNDVQGVLEAADAAVQALAQAIRTDQALGQTLGGRISQVGVLVGEPLLYAADQGAGCEWALTITYTARV